MTSRQQHSGDANDGRFVDRVRKTRSLEPEDIDAQEAKYGSVSVRLTQEFGLGDNATLRRELFDRCQRECEKYGEVAYRLVCSAVRSSKTARDPARYFAATVARRMRENGFFESDSECGW